MARLTFKEITIDMRSMVLEYTAGIQSSEYTFASMMIWGAGGRIQLCEDEDVLYIRYTFPRFPMFMLAPLPKRSEDTAAAIERAQEHMLENGAAPVFRGITERNRECFMRLGYTVEEDRGNFDYIYDMASLLSLSGKKYHAKRNHLNHFMSEYSFEYVKLTKADAQTCLGLQRRWAEEKGVGGGSIDGEHTALGLAFEHMDELRMIAGGIMIGGELKAFTMAERLDDEMAVIYFEKADAGIQGLYPAINQQFIMHELQDMTLINREEDMGIEGLRRAKLSYHPLRFIEKYEARRCD